MKIAIGSDHRGYELKEALKGYLKGKGYEVLDFGTHTNESTHYPIYAKKVTLSVLSGESRFGVLICATGIGMSIASNRFKGIRAALVLNEDMAELSRRHNNANVLCLGSLFTDEDKAKRILDVFLNTEFEGGRHLTRVEMLDVSD